MFMFCFTNNSWLLFHIFCSLYFRAENPEIGIKQMDFTDKWRIFDCTMLSHFRMHFMDWYVLPRETFWPWFQAKVISCYLLEAAGISDICEPL